MRQRLERESARRVRYRRCQGTPPGSVTTFDGRSPGSRIVALHHLPGNDPSGYRCRLFAYSCGGSRGLGTSASSHSLLAPSRWKETVTRTRAGGMARCQIQWLRWQPKAATFYGSATAASIPAISTSKIKRDSLPPCGEGLGMGLSLTREVLRDPHSQPLPTRGRGVRWRPLKQCA